MDALLLIFQSLSGTAERETAAVTPLLFSALCLIHSSPHHTVVYRMDIQHSQAFKRLLSLPFQLTDLNRVLAYWYKVC